MKSKFLSKILVAVLSIVSVCAAFSFAACSDKDTKVAGSEGLVYTLNDEGTAYTLTGFGTCTDTDVVIGNWYNDKPVTAVAEGVFDDNPSKDEPGIGVNFPVVIKSITVSSGITEIASRGLQNFNVKKIILGDTVSKLERGALRFCEKLEVLVIDKSLTSVGQWAFSEIKASLNIYYKGSESDWEKINIDDSNYEYFDSFTFHYNYTGDGSEL